MQNNIRKEVKNASIIFIRNTYFRRTITIPKTFVGMYWPIAKPGCGCAFETHKPDVNLKAFPKVIDGKILAINLSMYIKDRSNDCTEGNLNETEKIYTAPTGFKISRVIDNNSCNIWYWDNDMRESWHKEYCGLGTFNILAETVNDDLCDASLNDRTRFTFTSNPIRVEIEKDISNR